MVIRQKAGGAILNRATFLRDCIGSKVFNTFDLSCSDDEVVTGTLAGGVTLVTEAQRSAAGSAVLINRNAIRYGLYKATSPERWKSHQRQSCAQYASGVWQSQST